jgi:hypothetical protein
MAPSLTRGRVCNLLLLLCLDSAVPNFENLPTLRTRSPYLYPLGTGSSSYIPGHWWSFLWNYGTDRTENASFNSSSTIACIDAHGHRAIKWLHSRLLESTVFACSIIPHISKHAVLLFRITRLSTFTAKHNIYAITIIYSDVDLSDTSAIACDIGQ